MDVKIIKAKPKKKTDKENVKEKYKAEKESRPNPNSVAQLRKRLEILEEYVGLK